MDIHNQTKTFLLFSISYTFNHIVCIFVGVILFNNIFVKIVHGVVYTSVHFAAYSIFLMTTPHVLICAFNLQVTITVIFLLSHIEILPRTLIQCSFGAYVCKHLC